MVRNICEYQLRNNRDASLHCKLLDEGKGWCGFQFLCRETGKWENTSTCTGCLVRRCADDKKELDNKSEEKVENVKPLKKKSSYKQNVVVPKAEEKEEE